MLKHILHIFASRFKRPQLRRNLFNKSSRNSKKQDVTEENNEDDEDIVDEDPVDEDPVDEDPVDERDVVSTPATTPRPESTKGWSQTISKP